MGVPPLPLTLAWTGPYTFSTRHGQGLLEASAGESGGVYVWAVPAPAGLIPHYVGETATSLAKRHFEHFQLYASGIYSVRDADAFLRGEEIYLHRGPLWRKDAWRASQPFIDNFAKLAVHLDRTLAAIQIFVAPLTAEQRVRRRIESALVTAFYDLPSAARTLFPAGFRRWLRRSDEAPLMVRCTNPPSILGFPHSFEA